MKSNQSILKEMSPKYSLEGLMLKLTYLKRCWCWERLRVGELDNRGWDGWITSLTQWTWIWVNSRSWWWTGRPGMLQSMGSQKVRHNWATELNWWLRSKESACNAGDTDLTAGSGRCPCRRKWQFTPVFLPGKFHGQKRLADCSPWCCERVGHNLATKPPQQMVWVGCTREESFFDSLEDIMER